MKPTLRHRIEYAAGRVALAVVNVLPERLAYWMCAGVGRLYYRCSRRRQRYSLHILRNAFPDRSEAELQRIGRVAAGNVFKVVLDSVRVIPVLRRGRLLDHVDIADFERHVPPAPFVAVAPHLGSWEISSVALAQYAGESHVIARGFKNPLLHRFVLDNRRRAGLNIHPRRGGVRGVSRALREGKVAMQAADQNQRKRALFVPFFGELAATDRSAATMALRSNVPVVVGTAIRTGPGLQFEMDLLETIQPQPSGDHDADVVRLTTAINAAMEVIIRRHPEQYLWMHNRYRSKPEKE